MARFVLNGCVSRSEIRVDHKQAFNVLDNIRAFFQRGRKQLLHRILRDPVGGPQRLVCRFFRAKNRRFHLRMFNIKQSTTTTKNLDPGLKSSHFEEIAHLANFYAQQQSTCPRRS